MLFSSYKPIGPQPYPVIYVVANPVRGLLDRKISEEHLHSSNESKIKTFSPPNQGMLRRSRCALIFLYKHKQTKTTKRKEQ